MGSTDRLVELSARGDDDSGEMQAPDQAGVDRAIAHMEMLMTTEDLTSVALALELLKGSDWERCVLLQQLGAASFRSVRHMGVSAKECSELCRAAAGHPRDVKLFQGAFSTQQTRLEFASMASWLPLKVEKFQAQTCMKLGDTEAAHAHMAEAKRLQQQVAGDAVERVSESQTQPARRQRRSEEVVDPFKKLWAEQAEEVRLKQYRFMDEGPTVTSLRQFRVNCEEKSVEIQLRLRIPDANGRVMHFILRLDPLCNEIIPEDTVPRLRGKESKKRLEVKLFKREKDRKWFGDLVAELPKAEKQRKPATAPKGSLLNPLTPEEIAKLPKPGTTANDNRPSSFAPEARGSSPADNAKDSKNGRAAAHDSTASWVEQVNRERVDEHMVLSVQLRDSFSDVTLGAHVDFA
eukprot:Skav208932  [mRNA]  locus=scaffold875:1980:9429:+ [translate_table: standard]